LIGSDDFSIKPSLLLHYGQLTLNCPSHYKFSKPAINFVCRYQSSFGISEPWKFGAAAVSEHLFAWFVLSNGERCTTHDSRAQAHTRKP
jgi:hypothetical protein